MKISHFSKLANTSVRMLRYYEQIGLLDVKRSSQNNNYRNYSAKELKKVAQIRTLQELGFSLSAIKDILSKENPKELECYFKLQKATLEEQIKQLDYQYELLTTVSDVFVEDNRFLNYHVVLKTLPKRHVMSLRRVISDYQQESLLWSDFYKERSKQQVVLTSPPLKQVIYHDDAFKEKQIDIELQCQVTGTYQDTDNIIFKTVPETLVASTTFQGDYEQMPLVLEALGIWVEVNQLRMIGPMINIYHLSKAQEPHPDNWITESCLVVARK